MNAPSDQNYRKAMLGVDPSGNLVPLAVDSATGALKVSLTSGGTNYLGTWNASTNTPALASGVGGTAGDYYIVSVAGTTTIDGINDWQVGDEIAWNGTIWQKIDNTPVNVILDWQPSTAYVVDEVVIESSILYRRITSGTSGATFDATEKLNWEEIGSSGSGITDWVTATAYELNDTVFEENRIYRANTAHTSGGTFDGDRANWDVLVTIPSGSLFTGVTYYYAGDVVVESGSLYRRITSGTSGAIFDAAEQLNWLALESASKYEETFNATTDWGTASGGLYTITIPEATHGLSTSIGVVAFYESSGGEWVSTLVDSYSINQTTGDVTFNVSELPDGRFAGKVVLETGLGGTSSSTAASGIEVQEIGIPVAGGPFTTINFTGPGAPTVSDEGGGVVSVDFVTYPTAKGDLLTSDGADPIILPVGTDGEYVSVDSGAPQGLSYRNPLTNTGDIDMNAASAFYIGDASTDGTWRFIRNGTDLEVQLRVAGVYVMKGVFTP